MLLLEWEDKFSVGIDGIDKQHANLINLTNECLSSVKMGKSRKEIGAIIDKLILYAKDHFSLEEEYMLKTGYPGLDAHKKEHARFIIKITDLNHEFNTGKRADISDIAEFLMKWLINHIMDSDQKLSAK